MTDYYFIDISAKKKNKVVILGNTKTQNNIL